MELTTKISLILHLVGIGALLSGFFYQLKDWGTGMKINAGILHGAWLMLVTGFALAALVPMVETTEQINNWVLGVKSIVITAIFFIALVWAAEPTRDTERPTFTAGRMPW